ncbi:MAG: hypothetical protein JNJ88_01830 [Planctomycetes bacterium]|nr:hypothetical protein [Planctomycetota bacterium]
MKTIRLWIPAAFCAFLSWSALGVQLISETAAWKPMFFCFLPMCFFFVGSAMSEMSREIRDLRDQVGSLQLKNSNP